MALAVDRPNNPHELREQLVGSGVDPFLVAAEAIERSERLARYVSSLERRLEILEAV